MSTLTREQVLEWLTQDDRIVWGAVNQLVDACWNADAASIEASRERWMTIGLIIGADVFADAVDTWVFEQTKGRKTRAKLSWPTQTDIRNVAARRRTTLEKEQREEKWREIRNGGGTPEERRKLAEWQAETYREKERSGYGVPSGFVRDLIPEAREILGIGEEEAA